MGCHFGRIPRHYTRTDADADKYPRTANADAHTYSANVNLHTNTNKHSSSANANLHANADKHSGSANCNSHICTAHRYLYPNADDSTDNDIHADNDADSDI